MPFNKQNNFSKKVTDLPDTPSPQYSASDLKEYIQNPSNELKTTLNQVIDTLNSVDGAANIGAKTGNVQTMLDAKTDNLGDHKGTWQGFTPSQVDQALGGRVSSLEAQSIVAYGSNNNGTYIRYENGTQICFQNTQVTTNANVVEGAMYKSSINYTWTFPVPFLQEPTVPPATIQTGSVFLCFVATVNITSYTYGVVSPKAYNDTYLHHRRFAIGRWK